jgi:hypothetical protein
MTRVVKLAAYMFFSVPGRYITGPMLLKRALLP